MGWKGLPRFVLTEADVVEDPLSGLVRIPYYTETGGLYANRVVARSGRRWWEPGDGRPVIPFGLDRQMDLRHRHYRVLVWCEGESDSLALWAALGGEGVDVLGVPGSSMWRPEWARFAAGYLAVYVAGDGDDPGRALSAAVMRDVPGCVPLLIPDGQDVRDVLRPLDGIDVLIGLMAQADAYRDAFFPEAGCVAA